MLYESRSYSCGRSRVSYHHSYHFAMSHDRAHWLRAFRLLTPRSSRINDRLYLLSLLVPRRIKRSLALNLGAARNMALSPSYSIQNLFDDYLNARCWAFLPVVGRSPYGPIHLDGLLFSLNDNGHFSATSNNLDR